MDLTQFEARKRQHIDHALDPRNQSQASARLDRIHLRHEALPELDFQDLSLAEPCLGTPLATPFFIAGMTMGHSDAARINQCLAEAAQSRGWVMGVGSQRRELDGRSLPDEAAQLRRSAPAAFLVANLGISQLITESTSTVRRLVDSLEAQAFVVHLNPLQEVLQPEGTPQFRGGLDAIARLVRELGVPVLVKETGCGMSVGTIERLAMVGVAAIDVSGLGGTHWGRIEGARSEASSLSHQAAQVFGDWGESTVESVLAAREVLSKRAGSGCAIWASGGVRSGLDAAKLIALGAERVGFARPALQAAMDGEDALLRWMEQQEHELRIALFCTGSGSPAELRNRQGAWHYERS